MVTVFVGAKRKSYHLHRDLLCDRSPYFEAAFLGRFKEASTKELHLTNDSVSAFELLVNWLYGSSLKQPKGLEELRPYLTLLALAEKLLMEHTCNCVSDLIRSFHRDHTNNLCSNSISFIYRYSHNRRMQIYMTLLKALITQKSYGRRLTPRMKKMLNNGGPFASDLATVLMQRGDLKKELSILLNAKWNCLYHKHEHTPKCKGLKRKDLSSRGGIVDRVFSLLLGEGHT